MNTRTRLFTPEQAIRYARELNAMAHWRVSVFPVGNGYATLEIRHAPGQRGQVPPMTLRSHEDVARVLARLERAA